MKTFIAFIRKEFFHIVRDRRTLFILLAMPVAQVLIFGYAVTNEFKNAAFAVLDEAHTELSRELVNHLQASGHLQLVRNLENQDDIHAAFQENVIKLAVVIPADFDASFYHEKKATIQLIADGTEPNAATTLVNYAQAMILSFQQRQLQNFEVPFPVHMEVRMFYNPSMKSVYMFVPGVITLILMLVSAMMTSLTIAREKELGTMELLLASPLPPPLIIFGKVVPYVLISLIDAILILLVGYFVFEVPVKGSLVLLLGICILFILTSLSLGILISTRTSSQQAALLGSLVALMLPSILLSGFIFPVESMPWILQKLSQIIPAKWFIIIIKDVMLKGVGFGWIWTEVLILSGMTLLFLGLSIRNFKIRLE
ncbi:MAG: ABC transporter permease [Phaeodactylibacter sp.]|nr:ABC transporter permease [Phaeodactylibacter sp.]